MKYNITCLIIYFSCIACHNSDSEKYSEQNKISEQTYTLIAQDTVNILIDTLTSNFYPVFQFKEMVGRNVLAIYNDNAHRLQLYDFSDRQNFLNINLQKEGPDAVPELQGFNLHSFDSVFLFTNNHNRILLVDSVGRITDSYNVANHLERNSAYEAIVADYFEPSFSPSTNILTFWVSPLIDNETPSYYKFPLAVDYDIKEKKVIRNYGSYPDFFKKEDIYFLRNDLQRLLTNEYDIHYFDADHSMYLYHPLTKKYIKTVYAKSSYLPKRIEASTKTGSEPLPLQKQRNYNITNGRYHRLLFDKTNNLYYRFVRHSQELHATDGLLNGKLTNKISILILDNEFGVAGELMLGANIFADDFCFVSGGLLWISINHPDNPMNEEHSLKFIAYKPQKK
jgi:hypothetical protein